MPHLKVNPKESIRRKRIVFRINLLEKFISGLAYYTMAMAGFVSGIALLYEGIFRPKSQNDLHFGVFFGVLLLTLAAIMVIRGRTILKLRVLEGRTDGKNRAKVRNLLKAQGWKIKTDSAEMVTAITPTDFSHWGQQISVIFGPEKIFVNVITFGLTGMISPFHFWSEGMAYREFKEGWEEDFRSDG